MPKHDIPQPPQEKKCSLSTNSSGDIIVNDINCSKAEEELTQLLARYFGVPGKGTDLGPSLAFLGAVIGRQAAAADAQKGELFWLNFFRDFVVSSHHTFFMAEMGTHPILIVIDEEEEG